ncbi:MAG TPA: gamma-glutamyltransferase [Candidatus Heimdallarchaeota archaeon]|nr:gamma-glutamyltransferase [Candidatus Heimdallarchaeota archaeon]
MKRSLVIGLVLILNFALFSSNCSTEKSEAVNLSPANWPKGELEKYFKLNSTVDRPHPMGFGSKGMVVGTTGAPAVRAGLEALKQGGSAADAVLTTALGQISLAAGCWVSYAGIMTMVYYEAETGKVYSMHAGYYTLQDEKKPMTIPRSPEPSGRTALVPGFMAGVQAAHDRFGKLPFDQLFEPAIYFAEEGFVIEPLMGYRLDNRKDVLSRLPETKKIFTKENGEFYKEGEIFKQPAVAATLRKVATQGVDYMYRGEWSQELVDAVQREGGKMALKDLEDYKVIWNDPVHTKFRDYDAYSLGLISQGGVNIIEALNLLEIADIKSMGHYTENAEALYSLMKVSRVGLFFTFFPLQLFKSQIPDGDFSPESRVTKDTGRVVWESIQNGTLAKAVKPIFDMQKKTAEQSKHSDAVVAVDQYGNVAAICHSINTTWWGTTGIFVDGISIPDSANYQQQLIAAVGPGVYLPDPTNPLLVLKDGKPYLASSSIGSGLHSVTVQNLHNVLEFDMDPKTSVDTTNFLSMYWYDMTKQQILVDSFPDEMLNKVREMGQELKIVTKDEWRLGLGYWVGIKINQDTGKLEGAVSGILNGHAEGY